MEFTNNWSAGAVGLEILDGSNVLKFSENDFIINSAYIDKAATVEADWVFKGLDFGIIMKYNEIEHDNGTSSKKGFLLYSVNGSYANLSRVLYSEDSGWYGYIIKGTPCTLQNDSQVKLSIEMTDFTYKFMVNDNIIFSTKIENNDLKTGYAGLFSYAGNYCKEFRIYTSVPSGWTFDEPTDAYIGKVGDEE